VAIKNKMELIGYFAEMNDVPDLKIGNLFCVGTRCHKCNIKSTCYQHPACQAPLTKKDIAQAKVELAELFL